MESTTDRAALQRAALREQVTEKISRHYHLAWHLGATVVISLSAIAAGVSQLHAVTAWQWLTLPAVFLFANGFEWHVHRNVLHRPKPGLRYLYSQHTPVHHGCFSADDMAVRAGKEWLLVLLPPPAILSLVLLVALLAWPLAMIAGTNVGALFLIGTSAYVLSYEVTHLLYHLPTENPLSRLPGLAFLRQHHTVHHDPQWMQQWNFNVTVPLFDWILRTTR